MSPELCNIPDNTFNALDIILPSALTDSIKTETHTELMDCFVDSLNIGGGNEGFVQIFKNRLKTAGTQDFPSIRSLDSDYISEELFQSVQIFYDDFPDTIILDPEISYVVINGVSMNYSHIRKSPKLEIDVISPSTHTSAPTDSIRPVAREINIESQDAPVGLEYSRLEGLDGFQEDKNDGMTLNEALETLGFSEYTLSCLPYIFGRTLNETEIEQLILYIQYTNSIESKYGYNLTREDIAERPTGYFQYQVSDGEASKEVYNYTTKTFADAGVWGEDDVEVVDHNGDDKSWVRRVWKNSSYDTGLIALPAVIRLKNPNFSQDFENIGNPNSQSFSLLNSQEQLVLFLSDSLSKQGGEEYFNRIFRGDKTAIVDMYIANHNTNKEDGSDRSKNIYAVIRGRAEEILKIQYA